jgi:hypothetical protein
MNSIQGFVDNDAADKDDCTDDGTVFPTTIPMRTRQQFRFIPRIFHLSKSAGPAPQSHPCPK